MKILTTSELEACGVGVVHHFVGGLYAKETHIPKGLKLTQHAHTFDHLSALMQGSCIVDVDGQRAPYDAPALLTIKAGRHHEVTAITDVVWACLHATNVTDPDAIDESLIEGAAV